MTGKRYVLEGEWSGYRSGQRKVVHRVVITRPDKYKHLTWIQYTDGTTLTLSVRECTPRERVQEIRGYSRLIEDCLRHGVNRVDDLPGDHNA